MPWLPFYAIEEDLPELLAYLNEAPDVAFVVGAGKGRWIAVPSRTLLSPGRYCLWHVPSGPLPLLRTVGEDHCSIADPFAGWEEQRAGADPAQPYFGAGHPGIVWLNVRPEPLIKVKSEQIESGSQVRCIGMSSFEWIGNRYRIIGSPALPVTERWWQSLRKWVKKRAVKVPRGGPRRVKPPEIWAFPAANRLLLGTGAVGAINPH